MNIPYVREYSKPLPVNIGIAWYSILDGENVFLWKLRIKTLYFWDKMPSIDLENFIIDYMRSAWNLRASTLDYLS